MQAKRSLRKALYLLLPSAAEPRLGDDIDIGALRLCYRFRPASADLMSSFLPKILLENRSSAYPTSTKHLIHYLGFYKNILQESQIIYILGTSVENGYNIVLASIVLLLTFYLMNPNSMVPKRIPIHKNWIFIVIAVLLFGCSPSEKKFVTSNLYTVDVVEKPIDEEQFPLFGPRNFDVVWRISKFPFVPITAMYIKTRIPRSHIFRYDSLEIVFMRPYDPDSSATPEFCHISCRNIKDRPKAFIIFWKNHINKIRKEYQQDIGETTDTLLSTLDFNTIKRLYPNFKGKYKLFQLDSIILDPNFDEFNPLKEPDTYYDHIQFKGFRLQ